MIIYPAIDLKDGSCVRLLRGDMAASTVFSNSPEHQAAEFENQGFAWLHIVDLNGAFEGISVNASAVREILSSVKMHVQLGGGIRTLENIDAWLSAGVSRVILGTAALKNPPLVREACRLFPGRIAVGIDAIGGKVAVSGWADVSDVAAVELAKRFEDAGVSTIIYTDINRDGAMQGANVAETVEFAQNISIPVIASGGVSNIEDIRAYKEKESSGINGVIVGRAFYDGAITAEEALSAAR